MATRRGRTSRGRWGGCSVNKPAQKRKESGSGALTRRLQQLMAVVFAVCMAVILAFWGWWAFVTVKAWLR